MVIPLKKIILIVTHGPIIYFFVILVYLHSANGKEFKAFMLIPFKIIRLIVTHGHIIFLILVSIHSTNGVTVAVNIQKARRFGGKVEISAGILNWQNF